MIYTSLIQLREVKTANVTRNSEESFRKAIEIAAQWDTLTSRLSGTKTKVDPCHLKTVLITKISEYQMHLHDFMPS